MTSTTARIKKAGNRFEILVDLDQALKVKKGKLDSINPEGDAIFSDVKKGKRASDSDLKNAFGTTNPSEVAVKIIKQGEVKTTQEHRDAKQEQKLKQIVEFLSKNAINPQSGNPHTPERIKSAIKQAKINIKNKKVEDQIDEILEKLKPLIPIKIETKKVKIKIPAKYTGKAYSVINRYKKEEKWLDNGDLQVIVEVPSGMIMDFYDNLNSITHGSALSEEVKGSEKE